MEYLREIINKLNLDTYLPYLDNTAYLVGFLMITIVLIYLILSIIFKFFAKNKDEKIERKKPSLNEIIEQDDIQVKSDNEFIDVLAAIEEEMAAIRELYVGGYISKGVYISETDRLYEKAKIFGFVKNQSFKSSDQAAAKSCLILGIFSSESLLSFISFFSFESQHLAKAFL